MIAQPRPFLLPRPDADVDVVALREDPPVAAGDVGQLDDCAPAVPVAAKARVRDVSLQRDAVDDPAAEPERARCRSVRAVGSDDDVHLDGRAVDPDPPAELDAGALAHLDPPLPGCVEQERVEAAPLRHVDDGRTRRALDPVAVPEAQLDQVDLLLDHRARVDGAAAEGARREAAAARLVAREGRLVGEQDGRAGRGEVVRRGRARRTASHHEDVEALHGLKLQSDALQGGVPERPKGTGCKPVGSAYGGSNPPAPIIRTVALTVARFRGGLRAVEIGSGRSR